MALATGDRHEQIESMLSHCEDFCEKLSEWECTFLRSIRDQFDRRGDLSDKQVDVLERIYTKLP